MEANQVDSSAQSPAGEIKAAMAMRGALGCRRCRHPIGQTVRGKCTECGAPIIRADSRTVVDLELCQRWRQFWRSFLVGNIASALLAIAWWFGLIRHNQTMLIMNDVAPIALLLIPPAFIAARRGRLVNALGYTIGSWYVLIWASIAVAIDQPQNAVSLATLNASLASSLNTGIPMGVISSAVGLGAGCAWRFIADRVGQRRAA